MRSIYRRVLALIFAQTLLAAPAPTRTIPLSNKWSTFITPTPEPTAACPLPGIELEKRGLTDYVASLVSDLGSNIPSYVTDGVPNFFQGFPTGTAVQNSLSLSSTDVAALPTQVLNIP